MDKKYGRLAAWNLAEDIVRQFGKFNVNISISQYECENGRFIFPVKLKRNSREARLRDVTPDVKQRLQLPVFYADKRGLDLLIVASWREITYSHLPVVLKGPDNQTTLKEAELPYIVGHDVLGDAVIEDLAGFPHLLLGGSTNSGKSVGLQALITTIAYTRSPSQINFILIDVGATDLLAFEGLSHLSCPVIRDRAAAVYALNALVAEMERRIELEHSNPILFRISPRLLLVIDEFPALFMGLEKAESQALAANISSLLQRGRHAKIHVVLAAQNPTFQNVKVDLANITARIAFKCAKKNFSETILGEGGAENLSGNGDLLLKTPSHDPERMQGIYVAQKELVKLVQEIKERCFRKAIGKFEITMPCSELAKSTGTTNKKLSCAVTKRGPTKAEQQLADTIMWAFENGSVSINMLKNARHVGWNTASRMIRRLEELGIVDKLEGKLPRNVIPRCPQDLSDELQRFLEDAGYSLNALLCAFHIDDAGANSYLERSETDGKINAQTGGVRK